MATTSTLRRTWGRNLNPRFGWVKVTVSASQLTAQFMGSTNTSNYSDQYTITVAGTTPTNMPASGATPVTVPTVSGNSLSTPKGIAQVGSQVWVANNATNTISRFNQDGTQADSPLSGNGLNRPYGMAVVGSQVWVANAGTNTISRWQH
jgi:hypothetical protein